MKPGAFDEFCRSCIDLLRGRRIKFIVIGGIAVTAIGEPRFTADLDVVAFTDLENLEKLLADAAAKRWQVDPRAELRAAKAGESVRLKRGRFHLDIIVRSLFIEDLAYEHSRSLRLFRRNVRLPSPEDLVVLKVVAGRPRDIQDVEGILRRHGASLDRRYIERTLARVCDLAEDHEILSRWSKLSKP